MSRASLVGLEAPWVFLKGFDAITVKPLPRLTLDYFLPEIVLLRRA